MSSNTSKAKFKETSVPSTTTEDTAPATNVEDAEADTSVDTDLAEEETSDHGPIGSGPRPPTDPLIGAGSLEEVQRRVDALVDLGTERGSDL